LTTDSSKLASASEPVHRHAGPTPPVRAHRLTGIGKMRGGSMAIGLDQDDLQIKGHLDLCYIREPL